MNDPSRMRVDQAGNGMIGIRRPAPELLGQRWQQAILQIKSRHRQVGFLKIGRATDDPEKSALFFTVCHGEFGAAWQIFQIPCPWLDDFYFWSPKWSRHFEFRHSGKRHFFQCRGDGRFAICVIAGGLGFTRCACDRAKGQSHGQKKLSISTRAHFFVIERTLMDGARHSKG